MKKFLDFFETFINEIENEKYSFFYYIIFFITATAVRNIIEPFACYYYMKIVNPAIQPGAAYNSPYVHFHYFMSYVALAFCITLVLYLITKINAKKILRVVLSSFFVLLFTPILDTIISGGSDITYFIPGWHDNLIERFFTFFGEWQTHGGATFGIKIEITVVLILLFVYCFIKTNSLIKSVFAGLLTYMLIFFYGMTPYILKWLFMFLKIKLTNSTQLYIYYFTFLSVLSGIILLYYMYKNVLISFFIEYKFLLVIYIISLTAILLLYMKFYLNDSDDFLNKILIYISCISMFIYLINNRNSKANPIKEFNNVLCLTSLILSVICGLSIFLIFLIGLFCLTKTIKTFDKKAVVIKNTY